MLSTEFTNTYGDVGRVKKIRTFHPWTVFNKLLIVFNLGRRWLSLSPLLVNCTFFSKNPDLSIEEEEEKSVVSGTDKSPAAESCDLESA